MKNTKVLRYLADWASVWVAVFSFEVLAAIAVDPQINVDQDAVQALIRAVLIATGATGLWQAISWARRGNSSVPMYVQDQLPVTPPVGAGSGQSISKESANGSEEDNP